MVSTERAWSAVSLSILPSSNNFFTFETDFLKSSFNVELPCMSAKDFLSDQPSNKIVPSSPTDKTTVSAAFSPPPLASTHFNISSFGILNTSPSS